MYTILLILTVVISILMCLIVLIQESKGGGLASSFSSSNQIMGVRKTTDVIEKLTWALAIALVVFSVLTVFFIPKSTATDSVIMNQAKEQSATNANNIQGFGASQQRHSRVLPHSLHSQHSLHNRLSNLLTVFVSVSSLI